MSESGTKADTLLALNLCAGIAWEDSRWLPRRLVQPPAQSPERFQHSLIPRR